MNLAPILIHQYPIEHIDTQEQFSLGALNKVDLGAPPARIRRNRVGIVLQGRSFISHSELTKTYFFCLLVVSGRKDKGYALSS